MRAPVKALTAALLVAGCASHSIDDRGVMQVHDNTGGFIAHYESQIERIRAERIPVRVSGKCMSACVMFIALPTACVEPDAELAFHGAWPRTGDIAHDRAESWRMARHLPPALREQFMGKWWEKRALEFHKMTGAEAAALSPEVKLCG